MTAAADGVLHVMAASEKDHDEIVKIARRSPYTRDFGSNRYSGPDAYAKEWIGIAVPLKGLAPVVGFVCVRHRVKDYTSLYFLGVRPAWRHNNAGRLLDQWAMRTSPHGRIRLKVDPDNQGARTFWRKLGYVTIARPTDDSPMFEMERTR